MPTDIMDMVPFIKDKEYEPVDTSGTRDMH